MNHPKPEEWVPYVYGEATTAAKKQLNAHLEDCAQCRAEIQTWKRSLNRLDTWKVPHRSRNSSVLTAPLLQWAAAAAIILMAGIWIGHATAPKIDAQQLRVTLRAQLMQDLDQQTAVLVRQELDRSASLTLASGQRYSDRIAQQVYVLLKNQLDTVKNQLDTVAVNAAASLNTTAEQLVQLADYKEPADPGTSNP